MRSKNSSKSAGTQFLHMSSLMQFMAMTPSRARSIWPVLERPPSPLAGWRPGAESPFEVGRGFVLVGCWHPKRAKWKMDARRDGVMEEERGIQLKSCARHSSASRHREPLSPSRIVGELSPAKTPTRHTRQWHRVTKRKTLVTNYILICDPDQANSAKIILFRFTVS